MRRPAAIVAAAVVLVLLAAELAAVPLANRLVGDALARCLPHDGVAIRAVDRPVLPRLLVGRATGVEMSTSGLVLGGLRVEAAEVDVPLAILPWAPGTPEPEPARLELTLLERDLEHYLAEGMPFGLQPVLDLSPGVARLAVPPVPVDVEVAVAVEDRVVRIGPVGEPPDWWERLPIPDEFVLPDDLRLEALQVHQGSVTTTLVVDELPGIDGARECTGPLA